MIVVSTSGFSYKDWVGPFYPEGAGREEMLPFFSRFFPAVELNYSYYSIPGQRGLEQIIGRAPGMRFALKAHKSFTHDRNYGPKEAEAFRAALDLLRQNGVLLAFLIQFPYSFHVSDKNLDFLDRLAGEFEGYPTAVEFRHSRWKNRGAFDFLVERGMSLVTTDAPDMGDLFRGGWEHGGPFGYVRLHGRNAEKWYDHEQSWQRYDFLYSHEQIAKLAGAVRRLAGESGVLFDDAEAEQAPKKRDVYVFFNNHWMAQGVINALQLKLELGEDLPEGLPDEVLKRLGDEHSSG